MPRLHRAVILSDDLDRTRAFYAATLGMVTIFDAELDDGFRALHIGYEGGEAGLWLIRSTSERSGSQTRPEPAFVFEVEDLDSTVSRFLDAGSTVVKERGSDGTADFVHVLDDSGNELVLVTFGS